MTWTAVRLLKLLKLIFTILHLVVVVVVVPLCQFKLKYVKNQTDLIKGRNVAN